MTPARTPVAIEFFPAPCLRGGVSVLCAGIGPPSSLSGPEKRGEMSGVVVVGAQWGDEGKGKIVDWLSSRADVIVRFQGGHNAGHTLVIDGKVFKLNLLPSGVVRGGKLSVIGNGVVVDPWLLLIVIDAMSAQGVSLGPDDLILAASAAKLSALRIFPLWISVPTSLRNGCSIDTMLRWRRRGDGSFMCANGW